MRCEGTPWIQCGSITSRVAHDNVISYKKTCLEIVAGRDVDHGPGAVKASFRRGEDAHKAGIVDVEPRASLRLNVLDVPACDAKSMRISPSFMN